jgi:predicted nucleotidyltransferase
MAVCSPPLSLCIDIPSAILISFEESAPWSSFDLVTMQDELEAIFKRPVDLVEREGIRNPFRRRTILETREILHAA